MGDVIQFPKMGNHTNLPISEEERQRNIERYQAELALSTSIELTYQLFEEIEARGIKLRSKDLDDHLLMVCESIKSALLKACNHEHPLQKITQEVVNKRDAELFSVTWQRLLSEPD